MANQQKVGGGLLFKNYKKKQENHPDYIGSLEMNGQKFELAAWIKPLRSGQGKFMSISVNVPKPESNGLPPAETPAATAPAAAPERQAVENQEQGGFIV